MYTKIMVAIDNSDTARAALLEAVKLTYDQRAKLLIVHVVEEEFIMRGGPGFDYSSIISQCRQQGQDTLNKARAFIDKTASIDCETKLIELNPFQGRIAEVIIEQAKQWSADLLVIGTHGRRGFNHLLLGSVAENTIRLSSIPTLLIRKIPK